MKVTGLPAAILPILAAAAPTNDENTCISTSVLANFDDITINPLANVAPVPTPYKGLYYQAFVPSQPTITGGLPGIIPHSSPNYIYTSSSSQLTAGTSMISVNYAQSQVKSFFPKSFYFACVGAQLNSAVGLPFECFATVTGYQGRDNQVSNAREVCSQQFHYLPSTQLGAQQMAFTGPLLECFKDIQFLIVTLNNPGTTSPLQVATSLQIDDFSYSYKNC